MGLPLPSKALVVLALLAVPAGLSGAAGIAPAPGPDAAPALPTPRREVGLVWAPNDAACEAGCAYALGGWDGAFLKDVVRWDPATGAVTTLPATLPRGAFSPAAVWDDRSGRALVLGGRDGLAPLAGIVAFDPATGAVRPAGATLPAGRWHVTAVWTGSEALVFGGCLNSGTECDVRTRQILRYDPATDTVRVAGAQLPTARAGVAAAWDPRDLPLLGCAGGCAYVLGGWDGSPMGPLRDILRYNPATDTLVKLAAALPTGLAGGPAVWAGHRVVLFGGCVTADDSDCALVPASRDVYAFDPSLDALPPRDIGDLARGMFGHRAAWDGAQALLGGGCCPVSDRLATFGLPSLPRVVALRQEVPFPADVPVPPAGADLVRLRIRDDGPLVCVDLATPAKATELLCAERLALGAADAALPRGETVLLPAGALGTLGGTVVVEVAYRYDPARLSEAARALDGHVVVQRPFPPTPDGAAWWARSGADVPLEARAYVLDRQGAVASAGHDVPWLGQVLAAARGSAIGA